MQVFVDVAKVEIRSDIAHSIVHRSTHGIGRCQVDMLLVWIVVKQKIAARNHIKYEYKPRAMLYEKI